MVPTGATGRRGGFADAHGTRNAGLDHTSRASGATHDVFAVFKPITTSFGHAQLAQFGHNGFEIVILDGFADTHGTWNAGIDHASCAGGAKHNVFAAVKDIITSFGHAQLAQFGHNGCVTVILKLRLGLKTHRARLALRD